MFRVICVVDKTGTALDRLAKGVSKYHDNIEYHVLDVHPKRPSTEQLSRFESLARTADVIDYQYYRTAEMLRGRYEWLKDIPSILTHNNPYSITESDWASYEVVVANNDTMYKNLQEIRIGRLEQIPLVSDPYFWQFNENYQANDSVIMVANRIESKKGILPVALACKQLNLKMYLVGAISDPDYWKQIMDTGIVHFAQQISDEELRDLYYQAGVHVCNSVDNFESGTLPVLEAIFCGTPVLSRRVGHVPDIYKDGNIKIQESSPDNVDNIAQMLSEMLGDKKQLETMRQEAWMSIKDRNFERRAYMYQKLYREVLYGKEDKSVAVIVPVADKPEITSKCINAVLNQTYRNLEIIVVDDGNISQKEVIAELQLIGNLPFRYIRLEGQGYNLARARNIAAIEATSDILVFCDQRMIMENNAIDEFVSNIKPHVWLYGSKGVKKDFVENFSCILREDFVTMGMFNERCDKYGAMSQEVRSRARRQGFNTQYLESAKALPEGKSSNRIRRKIEIMESKNMLWKVGLQ